MKEKIKTAKRAFSDANAYELRTAERLRRKK